MQRSTWGLATAWVAVMMSLDAASAAIIEGYPDVIVCRSGEMRTVAYLHRVNDDGSAVYMTLGNAFATVTPDGVFHRDGASDCDGKTLDQLKQDGQSHDFGSQN